MMLWHPGALWTGEGPPFLALASAFLEVTNNLLRARVWYAPGTRTYRGTTPRAQSSLKSFEPSHPQLVQLACAALPIPSCKNHNKGSALRSADWPWCFPRGPAWCGTLPPHGTMRNTLFFQWRSSPNVLASSFLIMKTKSWVNFKVELRITEISISKA